MMLEGIESLNRQVLGSGREYHEESESGQVGSFSYNRLYLAAL
jgi:hypothetical protein